MNPPPPTPDRAVFKLLWKTARTRAAGRRRRQRELLHQKKGSGSDALAGLAMLGMTLMMAMVHAALGWMLVGTLDINLGTHDGDPWPRGTHSSPIRSNSGGNPVGKPGSLSIDQ